MSSSLLSFSCNFSSQLKSTVSDPDEIHEEQERYYEDLYSSHNPQVEDPKFNLFFENEIIKKLAEHQKESCEGLLTENECRNALKRYHRDKTPGTDGWTAEFYTFLEYVGQNYYR